MTTQMNMKGPTRRSDDDLRKRMLAGIPVTERRLSVAGISTAVLEGGNGSPMVLLHGGIRRAG